VTVIAQSSSSEKREHSAIALTVPCQLWFFNKAKPQAHQDKVLMIDARNVYRKVTRKIMDFSPEQLQNLSAIVWLYRGQEKTLCRAGENLSE